MDSRILLLSVAAAALIALAVLIVEVRRPNAAEKERRRRLKVNRSGRIIDCLVFDVEGDTLHFSYRLHGVAYTASQDISFARATLPDELGKLVGPGHVKYDPRVPANSIVVCEEWSGLRAPRPDAGFTTTKEE